MRKWQVERRKRTRLLIELGGLVVKAGIVELTGDDRAMMYGALLWIGDKLKSDQHEHARQFGTQRENRLSKRTLRHERGHIELSRQLIADIRQRYVSRVIDARRAKPEQVALP